MTNITTYSSPKAVAFARQLCLKAELFVPGWSFKSWLKREDIQFIRVVSIDKNPIGCFIKLNHDYYLNCGIFIKPEFRKQGLGKRLMQTTYQNFPSVNFRNGYGVYGSSEFFQKCRLTAV